jgi:hypothetical protein
MGKLTSNYQEKCTAQYCTLAKDQQQIAPCFRGDSGAWTEPEGYFWRCRDENRHVARSKLVYSPEINCVCRHRLPAWHSRERVSIKD